MKRSFKIAEKQALQFCGEFFDFANHPNYGLPNTSLGSTALGSISSASSRIAQLGLKFTF